MAGRLAQDTARDGLSPTRSRGLPGRTVGITHADRRLVIADRPVTPITELISLRASHCETPRRVGSLKDRNVLTTLNHVKLGNLTNIRALDAGFLTSRAWGTLRAVVQGVTPTKAAATVPTVTLAGQDTAAADLQAWVAPGLTAMLRGAERC
jgi:hypothetical protein